VNADDVVPDKIERELERLVAQVETRKRLPNGLKLLRPTDTEGNTDDQETDTGT
jgi:hypothetical protein